MYQASITARVVYHLKSKTFFKVNFPILVIGIGRSSDLKVSVDGSGFGFAQMNGLPSFALVRDHSGKYPVASAHCLEVFLPYPGGTPVGCLRLLQRQIIRKMGVSTFPKVCWHCQLNFSRKGMSQVRMGINHFSGFSN